MNLVAVLLNSRWSNPNPKNIRDFTTQQLQHGRRRTLPLYVSQCVILILDPKHVWSPAGGWWSRPANWKSNTTICAVGIVGIIAIVWSKSAELETRDRQPTTWIPSMMVRQTITLLILVVESIEGRFIAAGVQVDLLLLFDFIIHSFVILTFASSWSFAK